MKTWELKLPNKQKENEEVSNTLLIIVSILYMMYLCVGRVDEMNRNHYLTELFIITILLLPLLFHQNHRPYHLKYTNLKLKSISNNG